MDSIPVSSHLKAQLEALAREQGKDLSSVVDDVIALGLARQQELDREALSLRTMLDARYDDAMSGKARLLEPEGVRRTLAKRHGEHQRPR